MKLIKLKDRIMKKMLLALGLGLGLFGSVNLLADDDYVLKYDETYYTYDHGKSICKVKEFGERKYFINEYRAGNILVTEKWENTSGMIVEAVKEINGQTYTFYTMTTYGACKAYEDLVILKKDINNFEKYVNMVDPNLPKRK